MKTNELTGAALDWAVAKCEGRNFELVESFLDYYDEGGMHYAGDWSQGGPIIEREKIDLFTEKGTPESWIASVARHQNGARLVGWRIHQYGPTPLIAAMRCLVASKLGEEVDIPAKLGGDV